MDRLRNRFLSQVQVLQTQLSGLLEKDWGPERPKEVPFEILTDLANIETLGWSLPEREPGRSQVLFDRLAAYFESGFCLHLAQTLNPAKKTSSQASETSDVPWCPWRMESAFHLGQILPLLPEDREKKISLPQMTLMEVRRLNPQLLLRELQFPFDLVDPEAAAFVIRPSDQRLWVLFSRLPDVFLKSHLTTIHEACLKLLADFLDEE